MVVQRGGGTGDDSRWIGWLVVVAAVCWGREEGPPLFSHNGYGRRKSNLDLLIWDFFSLPPITAETGGRTRRKIQLSEEERGGTKLLVFPRKIMEGFIHISSRFFFQAFFPPQNYVKREVSALSFFFHGWSSSLCLVEGRISSTTRN